MPGRRIGRANGWPSNSSPVSMRTRCANTASIRSSGSVRCGATSHAGIAGATAARDPGVKDMPAEDFLRVLDEEVTPHVDPAGCSSSSRAARCSCATIWNGSVRRSPAAATRGGW